MILVASDSSWCKLLTQKPFLHNLCILSHNFSILSAYFLSQNFSILSQNFNTYILAYYIWHWNKLLILNKLKLLSVTFHYQITENCVFPIDKWLSVNCCILHFFYLSFAERVNSDFFKVKWKRSLVPLASKRHASS